MRTARLLSREWSVIKFDKEKSLRPLIKECSSGDLTTYLFWGLVNWHAELLMGLLKSVLLAKITNERENIYGKFCLVLVTSAS